MDEMDATSAAKHINDIFGTLFVVDDDGNYEANICSICDKFITEARDLCVVSFQLLRTSWQCITVQPSLSASVNLSDSLKSCYYVDGSEHDSVIPWEKLFLSRRTRFVVPRDGRRNAGLVSCCSCRSSLSAGIMPTLAIANGLYFGYAPKCLTDLSEVELALITPIKTYGYCFSYTGGCRKEMKGSLSYYRVEHASIARTVAHFSALGMTDNIVVLLYGKMTAAQRAKARTKNSIRTAYVLAAVEWLCAHNEEWRRRNIDLNQLSQTLHNPTLIDNVSVVAGSTSDDDGANIESRESFEVFFPDGSIDDSTGAQRGVEEFRDLVEQCRKNGFNVQVQADLTRAAASDYEGSNLVNTSLLQFPYGRGGLHERRQLNNGEIGEFDILSYVSHVATISNPCFHHELFVLILYNMKMKVNMVRSAHWKVRHKATAEMLSTELNEEDIELAVRQRKMGHTSNSRGEHYLKAIDAVARSVPHTNEAAKKARRKGECLQHHFGMPTHFLTVTPDDDSSILIQIFSGENCDLDEASVDSMTPDEISRRARKRTQIRLKFPGICALVFEMLLNVIVEEIIGWDQSTGQPSAKSSGFFGRPEAFTASVEGQGRGTLHVHFQIWIARVRIERERLFSTDRNVQRGAMAFLCKEADRIMSTSFLFDKNDRALIPERCRDAFAHNCMKCSHDSRNPAIVSDQTLRELRYKSGNLITGQMFAYCLDCATKWTSTEIVQSYLLHGVKDAGYVACAGEGDFIARMKAKAIEYQKKDNDQAIPSYVIEAAYNFHSHTRSCFQRVLRGKQFLSLTAKDRNCLKKRLIECECRYRLPARKKRKTTIEDVAVEGIMWYSWTGSHVIRTTKELSLRRSQYDLFQNQSCPAIGRSKLACNTNINFQFHGCTGQYSFKYNFKDTQADDREEFDRVVAQKDRILSKLNERATPQAEAQRRLLLGAFAHQRTNICGSAMSSFLTRNSERFLFSHETVWVPLRDLKSLLCGDTASSSIIYNTVTPFFQCVALHYLSRPKELEDCCSFDYYSKYEFVRVTSKNSTCLLDFCNRFYQHPSFRNERFLQAVRERRNPVLPQVFQYDFPDTAQFQGDILTSDVITDVMEQYAELVLLLFFPYRCRADILLNDSFTLKLRAVVGTFKSTHVSFLQNLQDAKSNCFRTTKLEDDLQRCTQAVKATDFEEHYESLDENDEDQGANANLEGVLLDNFLDLLNQPCDTMSRENNTTGDMILLDNRKIKGKGRRRCGYSCLASMSIPADHGNISIIATNVIEGSEASQHHDTATVEGTEQQTCEFYKRDLVKIVLERTTRKTRSFQDITGLPDVIEVYDANGSVASIVDWARKAKLDELQRRAFEVIVGTFILTFYYDAKEDFGSRHDYGRQLSALQRLVEVSRRKRQLICLLHGPGGSGKSTVIDLTMEYAREYCSYVVGVQFTSRTIVVTALTGVAATIVRGETTHGAVFLNQKRAIEAEQIEIWEETRLLLIDEISFASKKEFVALDKNLRCLKQTHDAPYGGLSIVFSGDFRQLEPIGENSKPIYEDPCVEFTEWINCFLPINGMHRFKDDLDWGMLINRMRAGTATIADVEKINTRVVDESTVLPPDIRYATYYNRDRDAINAALFEKRCNDLSSSNEEIRDSILILSDKLQVKNGTGIWKSMQNPIAVWDNCGEDDVKLPRGSGRMDPVLRLYRNCRVMLPTNIDVKNGQANGTQAVVNAVVLKPGATVGKAAISDHVIVPCVGASEVAYVELQHTNTRIEPRNFKVVPKLHTFKAKMLKPAVLQRKPNDTELIEMRGVQASMLINNATTGHKLQGSGVEKLFVHSWNYTTNWVYVMLSRVKTMEGLYLREPLSTDLQKYSMPPKLKAMLDKFQQKHSATVWDEHDYAEMFDLSL